ncbi:MAG: hypothetical protein ACXV7H_04375 [Methylobacter sp.]
MTPLTVNLPEQQTEAIAQFLKRAGFATTPKPTTKPITCKTPPGL